MRSIIQRRNRVGDHLVDLTANLDVSCKHGSGANHRDAAAGQIKEVVACHSHGSFLDSAVPYAASATGPSAAVTL